MSEETSIKKSAVSEGRLWGSLAIFLSVLYCVNWWRGRPSLSQSPCFHVARALHQGVLASCLTFTLILTLTLTWIGTTYLTAEFEMKNWVCLPSPSSLGFGKLHISCSSPPYPKFGVVPTNLLGICLAPPRTITTGLLTQRQRVSSTLAQKTYTTPTGHWTAAMCQAGFWALGIHQ